MIKLYFFTQYKMGVDIFEQGQQDLNLIMEKLTDENKDRLLKMLIEDKEERNFKKGKETIDDLKKNHVKIEKNMEVLGYTGTKIHIELPAVGDFEGYKFDCFVSNETMDLDKFEEDKELEKNSYSIDEIKELLESLQEYFEEQGVDIKNNDGILGKIVNEFHNGYWLKDTRVDGKRGSRALMYLENNNIKINNCDYLSLLCRALLKI